jgi:hypothetical protein
MKYLLLETSGCHLCDQAEELINECLEIGLACSIEKIDIAEQTQWQTDYAILIPVLLHEQTNEYLNWPFTHTQILTFIEQHD